MQREVRSTLAVVLGLAAMLCGVASGAADEDTKLPASRPLTDRRFESTPARIERGRYLSEHLLQCFICHSERDWSRPGAPSIEGRKGAGAVYSEGGERRVVAPNITPDPETGAGRWSDDMLARAIREGIGHDGRALYPAMWYSSFAALADEDLASVVVYLRTLPPVRNALPQTRLTEEERASFASWPRPILAPVPAPPANDNVALGRYLIRLASCARCHTSWHSPRNPGEFGGGNEVTSGARKAFSSNISSHASGAAYPSDAFIAIMRTGKGGALSPIMPWAAFSGLADGDLAAIHAALLTTQPVAHFIGNQGPLEPCPVCGQVHPLGAQNRIEPPARVAVDPAVFVGLAGRYRSDEYDLVIEVRVENERLYLQEPGGAPIELYPQSATFYLAPGGVAPVEFVLGPDGRARQLVSRELDPFVLERLP